MEVKVKGKDKVYPRTGHKVEVLLFSL